MTQAQLAAAIGVTSTSVHRWEAGISNPDFEAALSLWSLAIENGSATSKHFAGFLADRGHAIDTLFSAAQTRLVHTLDTAMADLSAEEFHLVLAFIEMLKSNEDRTADEMIRVLLNPWRQKVLENGAFATPKRELKKRPRRTQGKPDKT